LLDISNIFIFKEVPTDTKFSLLILNILSNTIHKDIS